LPDHRDNHPANSLKKIGITPEKQEVKTARSMSRPFADHCQPLLERYGTFGNTSAQNGNKVERYGTAMVYRLDLLPILQGMKALLTI
jgi:hypothetical protein